MSNICAICVCVTLGTISKPPECPFNLKIVTAESHRAEITPTVKHKVYYLYISHITASTISRYTTIMYVQGYYRYNESIVT